MKIREEKKLEPLLFEKVIVTEVKNKPLEKFPGISIDIEVVFFPEHGNLLIWKRTSKMSGYIQKHDGKVVVYGELSRIWGTVNNNRSDYNGFAVILNVKSCGGIYPSMNTSKTDLNWTDELQMEIVKEVKTLVPKPLKARSPFANEKDKEKELFKILNGYESLEVFSQKSVCVELPANHECAQIECVVDLAVRDKVNNMYVLIEGKIGQSSDKDVYQLMRYLEIWTINEMRVGEVILIADEHPLSVSALADLKNGQVVKKGDMEYTFKIKLKTWEDYGVARYKKDLSGEKNIAFYKKLYEAQTRINKRIT